MDSCASSRRSSASSSPGSSSGSVYSSTDWINIDTCGLEDEQVVMKKAPTELFISVDFLQVRTLKRTFDQFDADKSGSISVETVNTILKMMGMHVSSRALEASSWLSRFLSNSQ